MRVPKVQNTIRENGWMRGGLLLLLPPFKAGRIGRACQRTSHIIIARTERNYLLNEKGRSSEELNLSYLPYYYSSRESFSSSGHNTITYIITPPPFPTIPIATPTKQPSPPILHFPLLDLPFPLSALPPYPPRDHFVLRLASFAARARYDSLSVGGEGARDERNVGAVRKKREAGSTMLTSSYLHS